MFIKDPVTRTGVTAGIIATMIALLAMQVVHYVIGDFPLVSSYFTYLVTTELSNLTGEFARFLVFSQYGIRVLLFVIVLYLVVGGALGAWVNRSSQPLAQIAMQAAAVLLFATLTLFYLLDDMLEYYLQEIAISIALGSLTFAVVLNWLLANGAPRMRWNISGVIAIAGLIMLVYNNQNPSWI